MSEFDGFDPVTFARADTDDRTRNKLGAARRVRAPTATRRQSYATASASLLGSRNRNLVGDAGQHARDASRRTLELEAGHRIGRHAFIAAVEGEHETFEARDEAYGGVTDQDRSRRHQSLTLEWKMADLGALSTDLAVRHDAFSKLQGRDHGARLGAGRARRRRVGRGDLWRGHRPADLLRPVRLLPGHLRRQSRAAPRNQPRRRAFAALSPAAASAPR